MSIYPPSQKFRLPLSVHVWHALITNVISTFFWYLLFSYDMLSSFVASIVCFFRNFCGIQNFFLYLERLFLPTWNSIISNDFCLMNHIHNLLTTTDMLTLEIDFPVP